MRLKKKKSKRINGYNPIILNIIGKELFDYYQKLHNREKYLL